MKGNLVSTHAHWYTRLFHCHLCHWCRWYSTEKQSEIVLVNVIFWLYRFSSSFESSNGTRCCDADDFYNDGLDSRMVISGIHPFNKVLQMLYFCCWTAPPDGVKFFSIFSLRRNDKMPSTKREQNWNFDGFFQHSHLCAAAAEAEKYFALTWRKAIGLRSTRLYKGWNSKKDVNLTLTKLLYLLFNSG